MRPGLKSRSKRLGATLYPCPESVVLTNLRAILLRKCAARINLATRGRETRLPSPLSFRVTRGLPYESLWGSA